MFTNNLERWLPRLLDELADERTPDYYADLFSQTARTSQRSAWTIRERWLPMLEIARQPVAPQMPWRPIAVFVLLVAALAAGLALAAAQKRPPPLIGPAGNGLVVIARDGDIYTVETGTGAATAIVTGPESDMDPIWSQDGTTVLFRRASADQPSAEFLMSARANGSSIKQLTREAMPGLTATKVSSTYSPKLNYALSPEGRTVGLISTVDGLPALFVGDADGRGVRKVPIAAAMPMSFAFDPTGQRILYVGAQGFDGSYAGLYLIGVDGSNPQTLVEPTLDAQVHSRIAWSPDGSRIAYARFEPGFLDGDRSGEAARKDLRIHVMTLANRNDVPIGEDDGPWWEAPTAWSPDGHRLIIERSIAETYGAVIVDIDGNTPEVVPAFRSLDDWFAAWSPDGVMILMTPEIEFGNGQQVLWDARTGGTKSTPWNASSYPSWQRVAP